MELHDWHLTNYIHAPDVYDVIMLQDLLCILAVSSISPEMDTLQPAAGGYHILLADTFVSSGKSGEIGSNKLCTAIA